MLSTAQVVSFVPSTDLDRSRTFYESVLGLPVQYQDNFAVVVTAGSSTIRITDVGAALTAQAFTILGWEVNDLDAEIDALAAKGVGFLDVPGLDQDARSAWTAPGGTRIAWFKDPDGNTLSLSSS
jgi:catechol 2,3-dioxygenase-like lactoylglutathione lyase family enzyme